MEFGEEIEALKCREMNGGQGNRLRLREGVEQWDATPGRRESLQLECVQEYSLGCVWFLESPPPPATWISSHSGSTGHLMCCGERGNVRRGWVKWPWAVGREVCAEVNEGPAGRRKQGLEAQESIGYLSPGMLRSNSNHAGLSQASRKEADIVLLGC